jgi:hypothetical protein
MKNDDGQKAWQNYRTTFGRIGYHSILTLENAFANYKLKATDTIGLRFEGYRYDIPLQEHKKIMDNLIADPEISQLLSARRTPISN